MLLNKHCFVCFIRELDKTASNVSNVVLPLSLGNLGLLMADPTIDKTSLHSQIMHTYKWSARVSSVLVFSTTCNMCMSHTCTSVMLVDCDHIVQQKVEIGT